MRHNTGGRVQRSQTRLLMLFSATVTSFAVVLSGCSPTAAPPSSDTGTSPGAGPSMTASDAATRRTPVVAGRPARVFIFAGWNDDCSPVPEPELSISSAPAQGDISFKPGQMTTVQTSASGTCAGRPVSGTGVYYTARTGATGSDSFAIAARLATGESTTRQFSVTIAE